MLDPNELDTVFQPDKWIGKGIKYLDAPLHVILAREMQEKVPSRFKAFYPSSSLSVESFLHFPLPHHSFALSSYSSEKWFSQDPPTMWSYGELGKLLHARPLLTTPELQRLYQDFGQLWLNGAKSLSVPCVNAGKDCLPLWFLTIWQDMASFMEVQTGLKKAQEAAIKLITEEETV